MTWDAGGAAVTMTPMAGPSWVCRLVALLLWFFPLPETGGQCDFPPFVWRVSPEDAQRLWYTEIRYVENGAQWTSRHELVASRQALVTRVKYPAPCADYEEFGSTPCYKEELLHTQRCMRAKDDLKFIVQQGEAGFEKYSCIRFIQRGKSVLQIWAASKLKSALTDSICDDDNLVRNEWPWMAPTRQEWVACPLQGGYNFNAYLNERKRRMCHRLWRPSRIESECVVGDGLVFLFPERSCSPFAEKGRDRHLECWAFWQEEQFTFVVLAEKDKPAQFVMRMPRHYDGVDIMTNKFYFSVVTPLSDRGLPPSATRHLELRLSRSESGVCFDESREVCEQIAKDRKCTNGGLHQFGNHCKKSCGLCKLAPSLSPECHFPTEFQGEWLLYEDSSRQEVRVNGGYLSFSTAGAFICKGKHWEDSNYKLLSVYDNGCRPRFTCVNFVYQENGNILRFRLSKSDRADKSFSLCEFEDDPPPIGSKYRSKDLKTMFSTARLQSKNCGLGGLVAVNAIFPDGRSCHATLSDWNPFSCSITSKMALSFRSCKNTDSLEHQEFFCETLLTLQDHYRLLVTKQEVAEGIKYACWIIRMNPHETAKEPWRQAYILRRAQCGAPEDLDPVIYKPHEVIFKIYSNSLEKDCIVMNKGATAHVSTIRYTVRKGANSGGTGSTGGAGVKGTSRNRKQHTTTAHTQAVSQGRSSACASRNPSWQLLVTVFLSAAGVVLHQT